MDTRTVTSPCPKCGTAIPPEAPQGLCPRCVLAGAATPTEAGPGSGSRLTAPPLETVAAAFPHLEILGLIGLGGMGVVYKARQPKLDRLVALKLLPQSLSADPAFAERFNREARFLARLNHPDIVAVFDFGFAPIPPHFPSPIPHPLPSGFCYLLMEFVDGVNLRQAMRAGRFSPAEALALVPHICAALQYAHDQGVLHRDIKPENILLDARGTVKLADFGIAKLVSEPGDRRADLTLTQSGARLGTPHYMAPEQIEKPSDVDHRADIYSLGVVFYELLTGELPLGRFAPPSAKADLDIRVDAIVFRALAKERELRQQSAGEVKTQVEGLGTKAEASPAVEPPPPAANSLSANFSPTMRPLVLLGVGLALVWLFIALVRGVVQEVNSGTPRPVKLGIVVLLGALGWLVWRQRDSLLAPLGLGRAATGSTARFLRHAASALVLGLVFLIGRHVVGAVGTVLATLGPVVSLPVLTVLLGGAVFWLRQRRQAAHEVAPAPTPPPLPAGLRRTGWLFLGLGAVALLPSLVTWGTPSVQWHSGSLLLFTGVALLSQSAVWRQIALVAAAFALVSSSAGNLQIHVMASTGHLPDGWRFGIPGIPDSAGAAFALAAVQYAAFAAALWLLTRTDVRAAYGLRPQTRKDHLRKRGLIGGLAVLTLLSLIVAVGRRGLPTSPQPWAGEPVGVIPAPVLEGTLQARLEVTPPAGQETALRTTFWSNGVPVALPAVSATVPPVPVEPNPLGQVSRPVTWHLRAGLEAGVWELSEPVVGDAGRPQSSLRLTLPADVALQPVAFIAHAQPGPGERLRRWLFLPAADAANPPAQPTWGVSVEIEPQSAMPAVAPVADQQAAESIPANREVAQLELTFAQNRLAELRRKAEVGAVAPQGPEVLDAELAVAVAQAALRGDPLAEIIQARLVHAESLLAITNAMHRAGKATTADLEGAQLAVARAQAAFTGSLQRGTNSPAGLKWLQAWQRFQEVEAQSKAGRTSPQQFALADLQLKVAEAEARNEPVKAALAREAYRKGSLFWARRQFAAGEITQAEVDSAELLLKQTEDARHALEQAPSPPPATSPP